MSQGRVRVVLSTIQEDDRKKTHANQGIVHGPATGSDTGNKRDLAQRRATLRRPSA